MRDAEPGDLVVLDRMPELVPDDLSILAVIDTSLATVIESFFES